LATVARTGQTLPTLEAVREQIVADLAACELRDKAALYLRLLTVLEQIDRLRPTEVKGDTVDEIAHRRTARRAGTAARSSRSQRSG